MPSIENQAISSGIVDINPGQPTVTRRQLIAAAGLGLAAAILRSDSGLLTPVEQHIDTVSAETVRTFVTDVSFEALQLFGHPNKKVIKETDLYPHTLLISVGGHFPENPTISDTSIVMGLPLELKDQFDNLPSLSPADQKHQIATLAQNITFLSIFTIFPDKHDVNDTLSTNGRDWRASFATSLSKKRFSVTTNPHDAKVHRPFTPANLAAIQQQTTTFF